MNDIFDDPSDLSGGLDVPLSVWPIWSERHLVDRLIDQFTVSGETVALIGIGGIQSIADSGRHGIVFCNETTALRERTELTQGSGCPYGPLIVQDIDAQTAAASIGKLRETALTICADDSCHDKATWSAVATTIRAFGLLALVWTGPALSARARQACAHAGLSYAGHIVAAEVDEFDRAGAIAEALNGIGQGHPRQGHTSISLWARYPEEIDGGGL